MRGKGTREGGGRGVREGGGRVGGTLAAREGGGREGLAAIVNTSCFPSRPLDMSPHTDPSLGLTLDTKVPGYSANGMEGWRYLMPTCTAQH